MLAASAWAQPLSAPRPGVLDEGGGRHESASWVGFSSVGQPSPGGMSSSPSHTHWGGFVFRFGEGVDMVAPQIDHTAVLAATAGSPIALSATVTDNSGQVASVSLLYRRGGESAYVTVSMAAAGGETYQGTIPGAAVTARGLEYAISATDGAGNTATSTTNRVTVSMADLASGQTMPEASYRMVSVPIQVADGSPQAVMVDDFGAYDNTRWRLGRWSPSGNAYHEYAVNWSASNDDFAPGRGYWLIVRSGGTFDVSGTSVPFGASYGVMLQPGWNQIGNPFAFAVNWSTLDKDAAISDSLWEYTGSGYGIATTMQPWRGYWVENRGPDAVSVLVPPTEATGAALAPVVSCDDVLWEVRVSARAGNLEDALNRFGVSWMAQEGLDRLDVREPPPPWTHVWLYFSPQGLTPYATDYRPPFVAGATWDFTVSTAAVEGAVTLDFAGIETVPTEFSVALLDEHDGHVVDLRQASTYRYTSMSAVDSRRFHIVVGLPGYVNEATDRLLPVPDAYLLAQNHPNPVSDQTNISFQIPMTEGRAPQRVSIVVYDGAGREVCTLLDEPRGPGYYSSVWDGRGADGRRLPDGLYVYRMTAHSGGWSQSRRMILLR